MWFIRFHTTISSGLVVTKNNPFNISKQAVRLCRVHDIVSLVNIIYGLEGVRPRIVQSRRSPKRSFVVSTKNLGHIRLEDENLKTVYRTFRRIMELDANIVNACYITPHFWTSTGRGVKATQIIQPQQRFWTYRNQVIETPQFSPWKLFISIKLTEALFHLRPKALWRIIWGGDKRYRKILRAYLAVGFQVILAEIGEFIFQTKSLSTTQKMTTIPDFIQRKRIRSTSYVLPSTD